MKLVAIVSFALLAMCQAHMGMTLAGAPAREKAKHGDNYRSPHGTKICQGILPKKVLCLRFAMHIDGNCAC